MRVSPLLLAVTLLTSTVALSQPDEPGGDSETAAPGPAPAAEPAQDESAREQTETPPLRDEYEPRDRLSKDKAASFPPDI